MAAPRNRPSRIAAFAVAAAGLLVWSGCSGSQEPVPAPGAPGAAETPASRAPVPAAGPEDKVAAVQASIEGESISTFPVGSWIKFTDANAREITAKVDSKTQGREGWEATTSLIIGDAPPNSITTVYGSASRFAKSPDDMPLSMEDDTVTVDGKPVACKVFTARNGQKTWMSASVPVGGRVKVVGPKGEPFVTLVSYGQP